MPGLRYAQYIPGLRSRMQVLLTACGAKAAASRAPLLSGHITELGLAPDKFRNHFGGSVRRILAIASGRDDIAEALAFLSGLYPDINAKTVLSRMDAKQRVSALQQWDTLPEGILVGAPVTARAMRTWDADLVVFWNIDKIPAGHLYEKAVRDMAVLDVMPDGTDANGLHARENIVTPGFTLVNTLDLYTAPLNYFDMAKNAMKDGAPVWTKDENEAVCRAVHALSLIRPDKKPQDVIRQAALNGLELPPALVQTARTIMAWTPGEDDILRAYFPTEFEAVTERLPGRSGEACRARARILGIVPQRTCRDSSGSAWRDDENEILRQFYPVEGTKCAGRLPGRTASSVRHQANKLSLFRRAVARDRPASNTNWSEDQDEILANYGPLEGAQVYRRIPGKSPGAVRARAARIGVRLAGRDRKHKTESEEHGNGGNHQDADAQHGPHPAGDRESP